MKPIAVKNATLMTEAIGAQTRGAILLVMGATASMAWWPTRLCERLAGDGYQVIRFDHRDTGASTTGAPGRIDYDLADLADDLVAIMDAYDAPSAHLVGMSLGALVSQLLATQKPERVRSLTLIAAEPLGLDYEGAGIGPELLAHFGTMATLDWSDHEAVKHFMLRIAELSAGSAPPFDRVAAEARIDVEFSRTDDMQSAFNHTMVGGDLPDRITASDIKAPVLLIHGTEDPVISFKAAKRSASAIAGSRLVALDGRGHELAPADLEHIGAEILAHVARA